MGTGRQALGVQGIHLVKSAKPGKPIRWYIYAWRGGPRIRVAEQPDRPKLTKDDIAAIAAALAEADKRPTDTIKGLSAAWQQSPEWKGLAPSTRDLWAGAMGRIEDKWGTVPLRVFADPRMTGKIVAWRDTMAATPRAADQHVFVLKTLLDWGRLRGLVLMNPAEPVPTLWKGGQREEIIWLPEDNAAFDSAEIALPGGPKQIPQWLVDARRLAEFTGLRRADLVGLTWAEISETHIARTAKKKSQGRRRRVVMPIVPGLHEVLEELRTRPRAAGVDTVLVGLQGRPIQPATLTVEFIRWRNAANDNAGIVYPGEHGEDDRAKTLHDIRGTFATKLMTLPGGSLTDEQIATIMGWSTEKVAAIRKRYVDEAAIVVAIGQRIAEASKARAL